MEADELGEAEVEQLREALRALEAALRGQLASTEDGARPVDLDQPIGRVSRVDALQQQSMTRANRDAVRARLQRVEAALRRVDGGDYGACLACEEPIGFARLEAQPETPLCIHCQSRRESER